MNRTVLIIGSLDGKFELLRQIMLDNDCSAIQFSNPQEWRIALNQSELGVLVISATVSIADRERLQWEVHSFSPTARIVVLTDDEPSDNAGLARQSD